MHAVVLLAIQASIVIQSLIYAIVIHVYEARVIIESTIGILYVRLDIQVYSVILK